jgi:cyclic beta-1,2-glucan synthetase
VSYAVELEGIAAALIAEVDAFGWNEEYYHRAFYDDGSPLGVIDLLPQAFAVLARMPDSARVNTAMNSALRELYDSENRIIKLFTPPFNRSDDCGGNAKQAGFPCRAEGKERSSVCPELRDPGYVQSYPPGVRENGGQYSHAAVWLALACHRLGMREKADELISAISPAGRAPCYKTEPYYLAADVYTNPKAYGRGGWSLYTGSAGWYYRVLHEVYGGK